MPDNQYTMGAAVITGIASVAAAVVAAWTTIGPRIQPALEQESKTVIQEQLDTGLRKRFLPVGSITASVLTPPKFAEALGERVGAPIADRTWVLADGRSVTGSKYAVLLNDQPIPDLQGIFLRGLIKDGQRAPGSIQNESVNLAGISFSAQYRDIHTNQIQGQNYLPGNHAHLNTTRNVPENGWSEYIESGEGGAGNNEYGTRLRNTVSTRTAPVQMNGLGSETVPKNSGVYYYVKIN